MAEKSQTTTQEPLVTQQPPELQPIPQDNPIYRQINEKTGTENWASGLFDCFKSDENYLCLKATFCPCFVFGKTQARIRDPTLGRYERINSGCLLWWLAGYCHVSWILTFMKRKDIRDSYNIKGDNVTDCLLSWCCHCCVLIQQKKGSGDEAEGGWFNQSRLCCADGHGCSASKCKRR